MSACKPIIVGLLVMLTVIVTSSPRWPTADVTENSIVSPSAYAPVHSSDVIMRIARITAKVFFMILRSFLFKFNTHTCNVPLQTDAVENIDLAIAVHIGIGLVDHYVKASKESFQPDAIENIHFTVAGDVARDAVGYGHGLFGVSTVP